MQEKNNSQITEIKCAVLDVFVLAPFVTPVAEDRQDDHDQHCHKHDDDRDLQQGKEKCDQADQLFQQRHDQKNHCDQAAESTCNSNQATTHKIYPVNYYAN